MVAREEEKLEVGEEKEEEEEASDTVYVITFGSQVIWQYKMDLFPVAVLGSRNYFVWQNCSGRPKRARSPRRPKV